MASQHDYIDKVKAELKAMHDIGLITSEPWYARAIQFVASNEDMIGEMCHMEGVQETADNVLIMTETCQSGKCE